MQDNPEILNDNYKKISKVLKQVTKEMRNKYYDLCPVIYHGYNVPFGGSIAESIGPFPEFILRGKRCRKSKEGCCAPCFYSRMPYANLQKNDVNNSYLQQVDYVIDNFDELVLNNQKSSEAFRDVNAREGYLRPVEFVLTPTGSFFDPKEFDIDVRLQSLRKLLKFSEVRNLQLSLFIESHARDFFEAEYDSAYNETIEILKKLNTTIIFGFESSNAITRNVLYNKNLNLSLFEKAIERAHAERLRSGAFVFSGAFPMTNKEVVDDNISTFLYLRKLGVIPVVMFINIQPYTIHEMLYDFGHNNLIEPWTIAQVIMSLIDIFGAYKVGNRYNWLYADPIGGPPPPRVNIFHNALKDTGKSCSESIYHAMHSLRMDGDVNKFRNNIDELKRKKCYEKYIAKVEDENKIGNLDSRIDSMFENVLKRKDDYLKILRPMRNQFEEMAVFYDYDVDTELRAIKAELLCLGLTIDKEKEIEILVDNSYIKEGGFVHAMHLLLNGHVVNPCVAEKFCIKSPYVLTSTNGHPRLLKNGEHFTYCDIVDIPKWCSKRTANGKEYGQILRPHSLNVVSGMPSPRCKFYENKTQCKFCSLHNLQNNAHQTSESNVASVALEALDFSNYSIALSGGTFGEDNSAVYFSNIATLIKAKKSECCISVELVPPNNFDYLKMLKDAGVTSVIMNLEIWDEQLRRYICPGKSSFSREHYLKAMDFSLKLFGVGQVSSVLLLGLQHPDSLIHGATQLIKMGVIPTVIPFKPFDNCDLKGCALSSPKELLSVYDSLKEVMKTQKIYSLFQKGCTSCGGCSLESFVRSSS